MSLVGFTESSAVARIYANKFKYPMDTNQELFALGMANLIGSFTSEHRESKGTRRTLHELRMILAHRWFSGGRFI
jgi:hypothetical protein